MSVYAKLRYGFMKNAGMAALLALRDASRGKKKSGKKPNPHFGPPLKCGKRLKEIMTRHYLLSRYAPGAKPVAWVTSGAPVELLRAFDFYTVYPENHGALCGASKMGPEICRAAEDKGYSPDLCSYARIDLGHLYSGKTPVGKLPRPDILFASNNICQTVSYWYKTIAHELGIPLIVFDTPYNFEAIRPEDVRYMVRQLEEMIPVLEKAGGKKFDHARFTSIISTAKESSALWGEILATMKASPAPMSIFDAFGHLAPIVSLRGLPVALDYYKILLDELTERVEKGVGALTVEKKRLMWDNIAIWFKVRELAAIFAKSGMNFVAATYTSAWADTAIHMDAARPFESIARTYSLVILNNNLNARLADMERFIKEYRIDGLFIHSARSCKPYSVGQYDMARLLREKLSVPSVIVEADITDSRMWTEKQAMTQIENFIEMLED